jgi:hypothetical protein
MPLLLVLFPAGKCVYIGLNNNLRRLGRIIRRYLLLTAGGCHLPVCNANMQMLCEFTTFM